MSEDEVMATVVSVAISLFAWLWWYGSILLRKKLPLATGQPPVLLPLLTPPIALATLFAILKLLASHDVRDADAYLFMYTAMGSAWTGAFVTLSPLLGFSLRADVLRHRNPAIAIVISGWVLAVMFAFAGGNIGDGPHWGVVVLCALVATGSLVVIALLFQKLTGNNDALTIEHDVASGVRMATLLISSGAILGSAVAGDWVSIDATLRDFASRAWPAMLVLIAGLVAEKLFRSSREVPRPSPIVAGVLPALAMLAIAAASVAFLSEI